ncbi:hypothetical protein ACLB2K_067865 [Fragaria x ananassa]
MHCQELMLVRGYEHSKSGMGCCKKNALHLETMEEISKMRKLVRVFDPFGVYGGVKEFYGSMLVRKVLKLESVWRDDEKPLSVDEEALLRQAIYAGWIDRVAKRIKGIAYIRPAWSNRLFLHLQSPVSNIAPEFLVYSELIQEKKPFVLRPLRESITERPHTVLKPQALGEAGGERDVSYARLREVWDENPYELYLENRNRINKSFYMKYLGLEALLKLFSSKHGSDNGWFGNSNLHPLINL